MSEDKKRAQDERAEDQNGVSAGEASAEQAAAPEARKPLLEMREEERKPLLSANAKKEIREWVVSIAFALIAVFLIRMFLFTVIRVDGHSMDTTLADGERMIVTVLDMSIRGPQHGDIVICHYPNRVSKGFLGLGQTPTNFVKRVIGGPGDTIWMAAGVTYLNNEPLDEPYVDRPSLRNFGPVTVPEGQYFVMGDNRNDSHDSRSSDVGFLARDQFVGKVRLVMWPPGRIRLIP